jgi:hypothetical protein
MPKTLNLAQKQKLARKVEPFIIKERKMYRIFSLGFGGGGRGGFFVSNAAPTHFQ